MAGRANRQSRAKARNSNRSIKSRSARKGRSAAARGAKPIDLYYWPTPNG
jgi:hypothetical protein